VPPIAHKHFREAVNDDVEKAADRERNDDDRSYEQRGIGLKSLEERHQD